MAVLEATKLSRRNIVKAGALLATVPFAGGISGYTASAAALAAQEVPEVARNRTLILRWSQNSQPTHIDYELWNGYTVGANHQNGLGLFYEPLAFYSAFADKMIPWLAESWEYNADFNRADDQAPAPASPGATASRSAPRTSPTRSTPCATRRPRCAGASTSSSSSRRRRPTATASSS